MRYKISSALWGIFWIGLGVIIAGNAFHWWDVTLFFNGWWTLFLILPCAISIISHGFGGFSTIGLAIGILLLLNCQGYVVGEQFRRLLVPVILILIGLSILLRNVFSGTGHVNTVYGPESCYAATFASNKIVYPNMKYNGSEADAVFGGVVLDLRNAIIDENVAINLSAIFGGIDLYLPNNVKVKVNSTSFFGGVGNKVKRQVMDGSPVVYVNATCMFGGVDIR